MPRSYYVYFPHLFAGFGHNYINTEQSNANVLIRNQVGASILSEVRPSQNKEFQREKPKTVH